MHILMMIFLGYTPEQFFLTSKECYQPFGSGPWLCLNPISDHYLSRTINDCSLTVELVTRNLIGTFSCSCGFVYCRKEPEQLELNELRISHIKEFGSHWLNHLKFLASDESKSIDEISETLKVTPLTILKQLKNLREKPSIKEKISTKTNFNSKREKYRNKWLKAISCNPEKSKTEITKLNQSAYVWLVKNDRHWIDSNSPKYNKKVRLHNNGVNWDERDTETSMQLLKAVKELLESDNKPIRITLSSLSFKIGMLNVIKSRISKMPKSKLVIQEYQETIEDFQIRRVKYISRILRLNGERMSKDIIRKRASLRSNISERIQKQIEIELVK